MEKDIAVKIEHVSKTFRIPHEKVSSVRGAVVSMFRQSTYEEFQALDDVSFEVKKGEFFGIIGRNGSGKSTLLKVLAGIYQPDAGKVAIDGMISPFLELGIGFNPELSGRDNVYLNATVLGMTKKEIDQKFNDIVAFSELERFIDQKLKNYSSGMQVRLAFAVSIHANRDILLMDEVLAVGDSNFQVKCLNEFNKYREMGRTVIIVTHDISVVQRYCDRAVLLRNGKIHSLGTPDEVIPTYIKENISDFKEEDQSMGNGKNREEKTKITRVRMLDADKKEKVGFVTGEDALLQIDFDFFDTEITETMNLGVGMHATGGGVIFGYNTEIDDRTFRVTRGKNSVELLLKKLPLLQGDYFVNITLYGGGVENTFDFVHKAATLHVFSRSNQMAYSGIVDIDHEWIKIK